MSQKFFAVLTIALSSLLPFAHSASAQDLSLSTACVSQPAQCVALAEAQIKALQASGVTGTALDQQIGSIVAQIFTSAQTTGNAAALTEMARAITVARSYITDSTVSDSLLQIAQIVETGQASETTIEAVGLTPTDATTPGTSAIIASDN